MAYEIESWVRSPGSCGEERHRMWRIKTLEHGKEIFRLALKDRGLCRITLSRTGSEYIWDLWRDEFRDQELDASMRTLSSLVGTINIPAIDVAAGTSQLELEKAVADMVTQPAPL